MDGRNAHAIMLTPDLVAAGLRRVEDTHGRLSAAAKAAYGPDAVLGENTALAVPEASIAVPHSLMWAGPTDALVVQSCEGLVAVLDRCTVDPEDVNAPFSDASRNRNRAYLRMNAIRVATLCDLLAEAGLPLGTTILEVGALMGSFALPLQRLGYRVTVVDRYEVFRGGYDPFVRLMRDEGVRVIETGRDDEEAAIRGLGRFDCVISMAVIEHVPHTPRLFLQMLAGAVTPGGLLALDTPNVTRYWNRKLLSQGRSIFQPIEMQYHAAIPWEAHHREYTREEMLWMMGQVGCEGVISKMSEFNTLQYEKLTPEHVQCLVSVFTDPSLADGITVCGRIP